VKIFFSDLCADPFGDFIKIGMSVCVKFQAVIDKGNIEFYAMPTCPA
jgi:hypothetical protein